MVDAVRNVLRPSEECQAACDVFSVRPNAASERKRRVLAVIASIASDEAAVLLLRRAPAPNSSTSPTATSTYTRENYNNTQNTPEIQSLVVVHAIPIIATFRMTLAQAPLGGVFTLRLFDSFAEVELVLTTNFLADLQPVLVVLQRQAAQASLVLIASKVVQRFDFERLRIELLKSRNLIRDFEWLQVYRNQLNSVERVKTHVSTNPFILDNFFLNAMNSRLIKENWMASQQKSKENEFSVFNGVTIFTGTWNINGQEPIESISPWLHPNADIYVLGFQELDLSTEIYLISDNTKQLYWCELIEQYLDNMAGKFSKVAVRQLIGLLIVVYARIEIVSRISEVQTDAVGTGFLGAGNKGSVSCRFRLDDSYLCFVNVHLAADSNQVDRRNQDFNEICKRTKYTITSGGVADIREYLKANPWVPSNFDLVSAPSSPSLNVLGMFDS
ncbi:Type II inositol 1,4,5-trisphosphate 5-phosphatase, partial [Physocladia obscura]